MRTSFSKWVPALLVLAGTALLGLPRSALAALEVQASAVIFSSSNNVNTVTGVIP